MYPQLIFSALSDGQVFGGFPKRAKHEDDGEVFKGYAKGIDLLRLYNEHRDQVERVLVAAVTGMVQTELIWNSLAKRTYSEARSARNALHFGSPLARPSQNGRCGWWFSA